LARLDVDVRMNRFQTIKGVSNNSAECSDIDWANSQSSGRISLVSKPTRCSCFGSANAD